MKLNLTQIKNQQEELYEIIINFLVKNKMWLSENGEVRKVFEMDTDHITNAMKKIKRTTEKKEFFDMLKEELDYRNEINKSKELEERIKYLVRDIKLFEEDGVDQSDFERIVDVFKALKRKYEEEYKETINSIFERTRKKQEIRDLKISKIINSHQVRIFESLYGTLKESAEYKEEKTDKK